MRRKYFFLFLVTCIFSFVFPRNAFAASLTLHNAKSSLTNNDEYTLDVSLSISAASGTKYYLRGAFFKSGTTNYCGFTWNGSSWFNGPYTTNSGWTNLLEVTIVNNVWTGQVKAKIDSDDNGCKDSGTYSFKIERYTTGGSGSFDTQDEQTVAVTLPTPSPSPSVSPSPLPSPSPKSSVSPSASKAPTTLATTPPVWVASAKPAASVSPSNVDLPAEVLGRSTESAEALVTVTPSLSPSPVLTTIIKTLSSHDEQSPVAKIFLSLGLFFLVVCGILIGHSYWEKRKQIFT